MSRYFHIPHAVYHGKESSSPTPYLRFPKLHGLDTGPSPHKPSHLLWYLLHQLTVMI